MRSYMQNLKTYVDWHFAEWLFNDPVVRLRHPLYASICPKIEVAGANSTEWKPTSIMEPMDLSNCVTALDQDGFYEGTVSFWNLNPMLESQFGVNLGLKDPSWPQFQVLLAHWSLANLKNSHSDENKQRFFFPATMQTFVKDTAHLESIKQRGTTLTDACFWGALGVLVLVCCHK